MWLERLSEEHDNLRAALTFAIETDQAEMGLRLGAALWRFWHLRAHLAEGERWLTELLRMPSAAAPTPARAKGVDALASLIYWQADYERARDRYEEALALYGELGDRRGTAEALYSLSYLAGAAQDWIGARAFTEHARDIFDELGDRAGVGRGLHMLGTALHRTGDSVTGLDMIDQALAIYRGLNDRFWLASGLWNRGRVLLDTGDEEGARASLLESLALFTEVGDISGIAFTLDGLSELAARSQEPDRAVRLAATAARLRDTLGGRAPTGIVGEWDVREAVRGALSEEEVEAAWAEGSGVELEEVVAYARGEETAARAGGA